MEKIIAAIDESMIPEYYESILSNIKELVVNISGLGVVKRIISHHSSKDTYTFLYNFLLSNTPFLIQDPFANYALQIAIEVNILIKFIEMGR